MTVFGWIVLGLLALTTAAHLWLSRRQVRHVQQRANKVPEPFAGSVALEQHRKAAAYTAAVVRQRRWSLIGDASMFVVWTYLGWLTRLDGAARAILPDGIGEVWLGITVIWAYALIGDLISLPQDIRRVFGIEQRFGFNRTTVRQFVVDQLLGLLLATVIIVALGGGALWLMEATGPWWWLAVWGLVAAFLVFFSWAFPVWIAPLFNRYTPLADDELKARIRALFARCGVGLKDVYVMDGSRRSSHGNAFFAGLGSSRRVVIYDTLLAQLDAEAIEAVLAHEIGHLKLRHIPRHIVVSILLALGAFAVFGWLAAQPWFYADLGVTRPSPHLAILLFLLVGPLFGSLIGPLMAVWSRADEYAADRYAATHADGAAMIRALIALYRENASTLTPDPLYARIYYSHPPAAARIAALRELTTPTAT